MKQAHKNMTEKEKDSLVIAQADDDSAWEKPVKVRRQKSASLTLPSEIAARAEFFARLHREANLENWLKRVILERLDMEEAAFAGLKKDMLVKESR